MTQQPSVTPTMSPECAALAPLLPLVEHHLLDDAQQARVQAHLGTCAACRATLAEHDQVDTALRRAFAAAPAGARGMPFSARELLALAQTTPDVASRPARQPQPARRGLAWRRVAAGLPAVAAVLLLALLARYVFGLGPRSGGPGPTPVATGPVSPAAILPPNLAINSIALAGSEAAWAVGGTVPDPKCAFGGCGTQTEPYVQPVMLFLQAGHWEQFLALPALHRPDYSWRLNGVALASATEGWAVGNTVLPPGTDGITHGILLHYSGGQWSIDNLALGSSLSAVAMTSATDGWIAGSDSAGNALVLHYNGSAWVPVRAAAFAGVRITALAVPAPNQVWMLGVDGSAGGGFDGNAPAVILHYDGSTWTRQTDPSPHTWLQGLAMISPTEGWAVGTEQTATPSGAGGNLPSVARILHYQDGVWQVQASFTAPASGHALMLNAVAMLSAREGWAVGTGGTLVHFSGGQWIVARGLTTHDLNAIALPPGGIGWAMGSPTTVLRFASDQWSVAATATP